jgi:hypothetical protein
MTETFADAVDRLHGLLEEQVGGWRRLLLATRAANRAVRVQDPAELERALGEQVETLRDLKRIEGRRAAAIREVGPRRDEDEALRAQLRGLAAEVTRATRIGRLAIERNGAVVEARLALHRRAGNEPAPAAGVDRIA